MLHHLEMDFATLTDRELLLVLCVSQKEIISRIDAITPICDAHRKEIADLKAWRSLVTGGLIVISVLVLPLVLDFIRVNFIK